MKSDANERKGQHIHTRLDRPSNPVSLGHTPPAAQLVSRPTPNRTLHGQAQSFVRPSVEIIRINFPDRSYRKMTAVCSCFGRAADWLVGCPKCRRFLRFGLFWGARHGSAGWGLSTCLRRVCGSVPFASRVGFIAVLAVALCPIYCLLYVPIGDRNTYIQYPLDTRMQMI